VWWPARSPFTRAAASVRSMTERDLRVCFVTLGCKVNQAESEAIAASLGMDGERVDAAAADVVVVNTCTVTGEADHKARKAVRRALAAPSKPVVVVTGCLAALDTEGLRALGDRVVVEADKGQVAARVLGALASRITAADGGRFAGERSSMAVGDAVRPVATSSVERTRTRAQVKVEDGCDAFCSYCIVPYARGVPRPVPLAEVVSQVSALVAAGVAEVVLTGINIGRYSDGGVRLPELMEAVAATGVSRLRLSSIEPGDVDGALLAAAARIDAFCPHFHMPLQAGADSVLVRMRRPYDSGGFRAAVDRARDAFPGMAISTDIIVGFPGETDNEFAETMALVEDVAFSRAHVFRYSARRGTPAATMAGQVAPPVKAARARVLRELCSRTSEAYAASLLGRECELLVERVVPSNGSVVAEGLTREYLRARISVPAGGQTVTPGAVVRVVLTHIGPDGSLTGTLAG